jgi:hypothetical protein
MSPAACIKPLAAHTRWPWLRTELRRRERLEHRGLGLLDLQEERVAVVAAEQQDDPRAQSDAADADHLVREVDRVVARGELRTSGGSDAR